MNAIDQKTLPEIPDRAALRANMRYEMEGRNLSVMPDAPVLRHYRVDYSTWRARRSEIGASTSITRGGSGGGAGNSPTAH